MKLVPALLLLLLAAPAAAQSGCSPQDVTTEAMLPLGLQRKLLAHKIPPDDPEIDAPAEISRDIVMLRKSLDVATQAFFRCEAGDDISPQSLQAKLSAFLHTGRSKRDDSSNQQDGVYGANLTARIESAKDFANSIFVVLSFGIECGNDNLVFLYTKEQRGWTQRVHWYGDKYSGPTDAFGDFVYHVEVPGPNSEPLLAMVHGHSQCMSVHSAFGLDLIRPASGSSSQQILDHLFHSYVIDDEFTVTPTPMGLQIRTSIESEDSTRIWHRGILRFSTTSGKLVLLPVALNARDFVDEWLQEPWTTVQSWSDPTNTRDLEQAHKNARGTFGPVRACTSSQNQFQVEIYPEIDPEDDTHTFFARVRQNPNSFTMLAIAEKPDPTCTGPDIMKKR